MLMVLICSTFSKVDHPNLIVYLSNTNLRQPVIILVASVQMVPPALLPKITLNWTQAMLLALMHLIMTQCSSLKPFLSSKSKNRNRSSRCKLEWIPSLRICLDRHHQVFLTKGTINFTQACPSSNLWWEASLATLAPMASQTSSKQVCHSNKWASIQWHQECLRHNLATVLEQHLLMWEALTKCQNSSKRSRKNRTSSICKRVI